MKYIAQLCFYLNLTPLNNVLQEADVSSLLTKWPRSKRTSNSVNSYLQAVIISGTYYNIKQPRVLPFVFTYFVSVSKKAAITSLNIIKPSL